MTGFLRGHGRKVEGEGSDAHATCGVLCSASGKSTVSSSAQVAAESHYMRSSYRASLVEHLFIGSLLRHFWNPLAKEEIRALSGRY